MCIRCRCGYHAAPILQPNCLFRVGRSVLGLCHAQNSKQRKKGGSVVKRMFRSASIVLFAVALGACGEKGLDGKLDFSGNATELGESYGEAMMGATPEQQNVLRERMDEVLFRITMLARASNPAVVEAVAAKKNADELERLSGMSVREVVIDNLEQRDSSLAAAIAAADEFKRVQPVRVEAIRIEDMECFRAQDGKCEVLRVDAELQLRNTGKTTAVLTECKAAVMLESEQIGAPFDVNNCRATLAGNGGVAAIKFYTTFGHDGEPVESVNQLMTLYKTGNAAKIAWAITPAYSVEYMKGNTVALDDETISKYRADREKIAADLAVMRI